MADEERDISIPVDPDEQAKKLPVAPAQTPVAMPPKSPAILPLRNPMEGQEPAVPPVMSSASPLVKAAPEQTTAQKLPMTGEPQIQEHNLAGPSPKELLEARLAHTSPADAAYPSLVQAKRQMDQAQWGFGKRFGVSLLQNLGAQFAPQAAHTEEARTEQGLEQQHETAQQQEAEAAGKRQTGLDELNSRNINSEIKTRENPPEKPPSQTPIVLPADSTLVDPSSGTPIAMGKAKTEKELPPHITYDSGIPVSVTKGKDVYDINDPNLPPELKPLVDAATRAHGQHVKESEDAQSRRDAESEGRQQAGFTHQDKMAADRAEAQARKPVESAVKNARDIDALEQEQREIISQVEKHGEKGTLGGGPYLNGPQSMQFLANHMALTVGRIKGARTGKDLIEAHIRARDAGQDLEALGQRVLSGGVITYQQAQRMLGTTGVKRGAAWREAMALADDNNVDISQHVPPEFGGNPHTTGGGANPAPQGEPSVGTVEGGYRYKGGGAHVKGNWEKVQ